MEVDIKQDLGMMTDQLRKLGQELDKTNMVRNNLINQIQQLQGAAAYLRGKLPPEEEQEIVDQKEGSTEDFERSAEYPSNEES